MSYVGRTTRALEKRTKKHRYNVKKDPNEYTVITKHRLRDHEFDWDKVNILDQEQNFFKLCLSEMLHIQTTQHTLNSQNVTQALNKTYTSIFSQKFDIISRRTSKKQNLYIK